jgi:hypothetical protein
MNNASSSPISAAAARACTRLAALARHLEVLLANSDIMSQAQRERAHDWYEAQRDRAIKQLGAFCSYMGLYTLYAAHTGRASISHVADLFSRASRADLASMIFGRITHAARMSYARMHDSQSADWCKAWDAKYAE